MANRKPLFREIVQYVGTQHISQSRQLQSQFSSTANTFGARCPWTLLIHASYLFALPRDNLIMAGSNTVLALLCVKAWNLDCDNDCQIIFRPDGTGEVNEPSGFSITISLIAGFGIPAGPAS
jgi:hypothetical protein